MGFPRAKEEGDTEKPREKGCQEADNNWGEKGEEEQAGRGEPRAGGGNCPESQPNPAGAQPGPRRGEVWVTDPGERRDSAW